ncbi:hypothetical protein STSP2_01642 [Anaerohalosphaera lusitana]|uniref:Uncharacterized protein n=1 Tax=Anaerohalosphaera lusitana TaxID=1936003 RepID=A0A1U9NL68_9BACT|nr:DUF1206 domain-containing protein [Anaerohalosphaera lusitana]AQT68478.1 hypothetical protein STSP2_01642 [Anaerohalosphaera lusitana]
MADKNRKKLLKKQAKYDKKASKAALKRQKKSGESGDISEVNPGRQSLGSRLVTFAQGVRGVLFLILAISIMIAVVLADKGYIVNLEDIFDSIVAIKAGKAVLAIIAVAFFVLGLKNLRAIK